MSWLSSIQEASQIPGTFSCDCFLCHLFQDRNEHEEEEELLGRWQPHPRREPFLATSLPIKESQEHAPGKIPYKYKIYPYKYFTGSLFWRRAIWLSMAEGKDID